MLPTANLLSPLMVQALPPRRPIASRSSGWARRCAALLARGGVTPNQISVASVGLSVAGAGLMLTGGWACWLGAAVCVQGRLVCNLLDGMVAIEHGRATPSGPLFNDVPDRVSDTVLLVALGFAGGHAGLGWAAALMALGTAYVRTLGGALVRDQDFSGIMAKQQRMAVLIIALLAAPAGGGRAGLAIAAALIAGGATITCCTRLSHIARRLAA